MTTIILSDLISGKDDSEVSKVLLVDPDPQWRRALATVIHQSGYEPIEADDALAAQVMCRVEQPNAAVVYCNVPDLSAAELLAQLNVSEYVPVIFLSECRNEEMLEDTLETGAFLCLAKPGRPLELLPFIRAALHNASVFRTGAPARLADARLSELQLRIINVATGLLMERLNIGQRDAYGRLRQYARRERTKVIEVANRLLEASEQTNQLFSSVGAMSACNEPAAVAGPETSSKI